MGSSSLGLPPGFEVVKRGDALPPGFTIVDSGDALPPGFEVVKRGDALPPGFELSSSSNTQAPPRPQGEGFVEGAKKDIALGYRAALADIEHIVANLAKPLSADVSADLERRAQSNAPTAEEMAGRDGVKNAIFQGVGSLPLSAVKYAPAIAAKKYAPIAAGAIDAVGAADKGAVAALEAGAKGAASFYLLDKAGKLPTRTGRALGSAAAMAVPTALETGGDISKTASAAVLGGVVGGIAKHPSKTKVPESLKTLSDAKASAADDLAKILNPAARGENAKKTIQIARPHLAEQAQRADRAEFALRQARDFFDSAKADKTVTGGGGMSREGLDFMAAIEGGNIRAVPENLRAQAQVIRDSFDERMAKIQEYGLLNQWVENYFPHLWTRPEKAARAFTMIGKRPLEGPKSFLRKRRFETVADGLEFAKENPEFGLELASHNPIDIALMKMREQDRLITAKEIMKEMKGNDLLTFVRPGDKPPAGYTKIDDKVSSVMVRKGGMQTLVGYWYAPEDAARVMNNYLSPGLRGKQWFRATNLVANSMNQFQLGWSAFHLGFTTIDAAMSNFSLGLERAVHGLQTGNTKMLAGAAKDWLMAIPRAVEPVATPFIPGMKERSFSNKLMKEWLTPGSHPDVAPMVEYAKQAGARMQMDPFYRTQIYRQMKRSWSEGNKLAAGLKVLPAITESVMRPIMEHVVPRQKIAAFSRMAEFEMERLGQNPTQAQLRGAMQKAWDSVDNRMGQLVYDNLFWNQTAKDLAMASVRSVGWNLGTFREIGGGLGDFATIYKRANSGNEPVLTHRMAYVMTLPVVAGLAGAITTKLFTGENPRSLNDYYFPRIGGKDEYGRDQRIALPTYMKDVFAWGRPASNLDFKGVARVAKGKIHPFLTGLTEMLTNQDWQNNAIRDEEDNVVQQALQIARYGAEEFLPIPFKGAYEDWKKSKEGLPPRRNLSPAAEIRPFFGVTDANADVKKTDAERYLDAHADDNRSPTSKDPIGQKKFERVRDLERAFRNGVPEEKIQEIAAPWVESGHFGDKEIEQARKRAAIHPLLRRLKDAPFKNALKAYELALPDENITPEVFNELHEIMQQKVYSKLDELSGVPEKSPEKLKIMQKLRELGLLSPVTPPGTAAPPQ